MWRLVFISCLLVVGAIALARGLYLQRQLTEQLDTGAMGAIRSWVMWSTTEGNELVTWYRQVTPWLIGGGSVLLLSGAVLAIYAPKVQWKKRNEKALGEAKKKAKKNK
jgi:hypothetical protein